MLNNIKLDADANSKKADLAALAKTHDIVLNPKRLRLLCIHRWVSEEPTLCEIEMFRYIGQLELKYPLDPALSEPYLELTKGYVDILNWLTWDPEYFEDPNVEDDCAAFPQIVDQFLIQRGSFVKEDPDETSLEELVSASGKLRVLDRLLVKLHKGGHRVVLFSQFAQMVDLLDDYCALRGFNYLRLTGSTNRVQRMVNLQAFNAPGSKVCLSLEP